ncbi:hypothetical protein MYX84_13115 [Acidobacteria bacterium AH-259-O06]|nr:hypothetical protein [Acidobacteria bacterium AH-259-O06]
MVEIFKQLFCFFLDGSSRHLVYFDALKEDAAYAGAIETDSKALLSSHAVKRFFWAFRMWRIGLFRRLLQQLFLWRLRLQKPAVVLLGLDTMVMDNDEAPGREGVAPTYKRVKGFQPLQVTWAILSSTRSFGVGTNTPTTRTRPRRRSAIWWRRSAEATAKTCPSLFAWAGKKPYVFVPGMF